MDVHVDRGVFIDTIETLTPAGEDPTPAAFELACAQAGTPLFGAVCATAMRHARGVHPHAVLAGWALPAAAPSGKEAVTPAQVLDTAIGSYDPELGRLRCSGVVRTAAAGIQTDGLQELQRCQQASDRAAALSVLQPDALMATTDGEPRHRIAPTPLRHWFEQTHRAFFDPACA